MMLPLGYTTAKVENQPSLQVIAYWYIDLERPYVLIMRFIQDGQNLDWEVERNSLRDTLEKGITSGSFELVLYYYQGIYLVMELKNVQVGEQTRLYFNASRLAAILRKSYKFASEAQELTVIDEGIEKAIENLWTI